MYRPQLRWLLALSLILPLLVSQQAAFARPAVPAASAPAASAAFISPHTAEQVELVDQLGGQPQAITLSGGMAYVVIGPRLYILNVSANPGHVSQIVGSLLSPLLAQVHSVFVADGYVYLTSGVYGLLIINATDPAHPALVGQLSLPGQANDVTVQGSYAFVADGVSGLHSVDVSQKSQPVLADTLATHSAFALVSIGSYLYVADFDRLLVVNKSNPAQITENSFSPLTGATDIAYVPSAAAIYLPSSGGLREFLVTTPGAFLLNDTEPAAFGAHLAANSSYIYMLLPGQVGHDVMTLTRSGLNVVSTTSFDGHAVDLATDASNYVYKLDYDTGIHIYSLQAGSLVFTGGLMTDLGSALGLDLTGTSLHAAAESRGLVTFDLSYPGKPQAVNEVDVVGEVTNVDSTASYAYLAAGDDGLRIVSTSGSGGEVGSFTLTGMEVTDLAVRSRRAGLENFIDVFMGTYKGVVAVNAINPASVAPLGALTTPKVNEIQLSVSRLSTAPTYAYIATEEDFQILDVTNPTSITPAGSYPAVPRAILGIDIQSTFAYLCFAGGMDIVDISDPADIILLGHYPMSCTDVDVIGDRAYVLSYERVTVFDVSNRSDPRRVGYYTLTGIPDDILAYQASGTPYTYIYVSDVVDGLWVLRYSERAYLPLLMR